jgi:predicted phage terminase large subunit-like protein
MTATDFAEADYTEEEILASICRISFYEFVREFWEEVVKEDPVWNWHIKYLCEEMQAVAERVFRGEEKQHDLIINISPGTTKSTICSVMFPAWAWARMTSCKIICGSYTSTLSLELSRKCRDVIKSEKYRAVFPEVRIREDQDAKGFFVNTKGGSRYSVGVGGSVMGMHAHFIIIDDPLDPQEAVSEASLRTANLWMSETLPSRKVNKAVTVTILIMQRLHQDDPTGNRLAKKDAAPVRHVCLPAELTDDVSPKECRDFYTNGLMDTVRLNRKVLDEAHAELLDYGYAGQFLQRPVPRGGGMFQTGKIITEAMRPPDSEFLDIVRYWDKAASHMKGDWTVGVKLGLHRDRRTWVLDVDRFRLNTNARDRRMLLVATMDGRGVRIGLEQEPGSGGKESAEASVRMFAGYSVSVDKVGEQQGDKVKRADPLSSQVNGGNVVIAKAGWNRDYLSELMYFPYGKWDDQVDASSGAYNKLAKPRLVVGGFGARRR